jgi:hypothetical protein
MNIVRQMPDTALSFFRQAAHVFNERYLAVGHEQISNRCRLDFIRAWMIRFLYLATNLGPLFLSRCAVWRNVVTLGKSDDDANLPAGAAVCIELLLKPSAVGNERLHALLKRNLIAITLHHPTVQRRMRH